MFSKSTPDVANKCLELVTKMFKVYGGKAHSQLFLVLMNEEMTELQSLETLFPTLFGQLTSENETFLHFITRGRRNASTLAQILDWITKKTPTHWKVKNNKGQTPYEGASSLLAPTVLKYLINNKSKLGFDLQEVLFPPDLPKDSKYPSALELALQNMNEEGKDAWLLVTRVLGMPRCPSLSSSNTKLLHSCACLEVFFF